MFWRFGGYANISTLNNILEKPDVTLEEVLDETDLIQELKQSNSKLIEFLRDENVLRRLLENVTTPPTPKPEGADDEEESDDERIEGKSLSPFRRSKEKKEKSKAKEDFEEWDKQDKARVKSAYTSCEVLSSETWSILESLIENQQLLRSFWDFLRRDAPLDPTEAGYFTKINETLLDKKTEEMIKFLQSLDGIIPAMLNHIDCAAVMDLLLKIISMEKSEGGFGVVDVCHKAIGQFRRVRANQPAVVTKPEHHPSPTCIPRIGPCTRYANIRRRFHESHCHDLSKCVPK